MSNSFFPVVVELAREQPLHLGESREFTREPHAKGDASKLARMFPRGLLCHNWRACSQVMVKLEV